MATWARLTRQAVRDVFAGLALALAIMSVPQEARAQMSGTNPQVPDYIYARRMERLDQQSPITLEYNTQVRAYIDVYLERRRDHLANILGRAELYFPIFEEYLSKYNLPQELKYLAVIESALDPKAKSKSGAMGLWQFLYHAGLMMDLKVTSYEDERCDVRKSTDAACRYLKYLFQNLGATGSWHWRHTMADWAKCKRRRRGPAAARRPFGNCLPTSRQRCAPTCRRSLP